jgi:hypothetical protein
MQIQSPQSEYDNRIFGGIIAFIFGGLFITSVFWILSSQEWTGFTGKTTWDWLDLLLVPGILIILIPIVNWLIARAQKRHEMIEREIALETQREEAMNSYMELMTALLLEKGLGREVDKDE